MVAHDVSRRLTVPVNLLGQRLYPIAEALSRAGVSRATYFRWVKTGRVADAQYRDRNGRRVFTEDEMLRLTHEAQRLREASPQIRMSLDSSNGSSR